MPSDKFIDNWFAPVTTWYLRTADNVGSSISFKPLRPSSSNKLTKALLTGAKTVRGVGGLVDEFNKPTKSIVRSSLVRACTKISKFGSARANVTTVGNPITLSTMWTIPLLATTSAVVTDDTPLNITPLSVLI